ncbi:uncharacterized protein LOC107027476 [Solanum pennellii]|uniref:Uncharacterized protein LOC107027476 n=1 Tax=Solanum pennellii TaxID=28526 RepID=A0ABM1HE05_SOLPN|nr:uncharacterized protein LOC107027476 [Solanum pennellii]
MRGFLPGGNVPQVNQVPQGVQDDQVPIVDGNNKVSIIPPEMDNGEIREALLTLARAMTTQVNRDIGPRVNAMESTMTSRLRDFVRMNPPTFFGSTVVEDPQAFLDESLNLGGELEMLIGEELMSKFNISLRIGIQNQDGFSAPKVNHERGSGSQVVRPTCATCGKKHCGKSLAGTSGCFGCWKDDHQVRDCPTISARGRKAKKVPANVSDSGAPRRNHFYALRAKGAKSDDDVMSVSYSFLSLVI